MMMTIIRNIQMMLDMVDGLDKVDMCFLASMVPRDQPPTPLLHMHTNNHTHTHAQTHTQGKDPKVPHLDRNKQL